MLIRRVLLTLVAMAVLVGGSTPLFAQAPKASKEQAKRNKQQQADAAVLVQLVDKVSAAEPVTAAGTASDQRQGEVVITWDSNHFLKAQDGMTYTPFTVQVDPAALGSPNAALYVRAINRTPPAATGKDDKNKDKGKATFAWDNSYSSSVRADGKLSRAIALPGGDYEVFIAIKDAGTGDKKQIPKMGLLRRNLTVPDFKKPELVTSSILVGSIAPLEQLLTPDQQAEAPYSFGTMKIEPVKDPKIPKTGELSLVFWIYGVGNDPVTGKPNVLVEYNFHQKTADGETFFNKTAPQELNAQSLPPQFDVTAGYQLPGSLAVPLASFPAGDYRLEIKVTDKVAGKSITQNVNFSVAAS